MNTQELRKELKLTRLGCELSLLFKESSNDSYNNKKWDYTSIRREIDRIMNAHTKSELTIAYLERLKLSVKKQMNEETDKYTIRSMQNGISDIINCISNIKLHIQNKRLDSVYGRKNP